MTAKSKNSQLEELLFGTIIANASSLDILPSGKNHNFEPPPGGGGILVALL